MSLPNYQRILKSAGRGSSVEKPVEGAGRCLLSRTPWQDLDSDMTCPYYPHHLKLRGAQWHLVTIKGLRTWAQQVLRLEVSLWNCKSSTLAVHGMEDRYQPQQWRAHFIMMLQTLTRNAPVNCENEWIMSTSHSLLLLFASVSTWAYNAHVCLCECVCVIYKETERAKEWLD